MTAQQKLLEASDAEIEDAIGYADPMALRGLLFQLTGDATFEEMEIGLLQVGNFFASKISKEEDVARLRAAAAKLMRDLRDSGADGMPIGSPDRLVHSLGLSVGATLPPAERDMWLEQTALDPWARGLDWKRQPDPERLAQFTVAVVGTGLSGLDAAVQLKRAGINFIAFEKNAEVGGTWYENRYPGARVDSPSRTYTHLFGVAFPYPFSFCPQKENLGYMRWVADSFGLREHIRFNTEITSMIWDEAAQEWELTSAVSEGERRWRVNAVISCVGFLSRPKLPVIEGMQDFRGVSTHTAKWPAGLNVEGKRVAVVGSGASGYQTTPVIAKTAAHTCLFQRTPSWCFDNPNYVLALPEQALWLDRNFPYYVNFARFRLSWIYGPEGFKSVNRIDPDFTHPHARSAVNQRTWELRTDFIRQKLASRPDLIEKMIPKAPPMSSRPVMVDSQENIYDALLRDDVTLVTDKIERITPEGILAGGTEYKLDVIVYATGYRANEFLWPMEVRGRDGARIEDLWAKDGPRAYICTMLPGFPNFFMAYGPNSNNFGGFQVVDLLEMEIRFALQCIAGLIAEGKTSVDVSQDAYWRYNDELDREERMMIYMDQRCRNYYQSDFGRSCVNGPIDFRRMWRWLRDPTAPDMAEADAGLRPFFGEDLVVA